MGLRSSGAYSSGVSQQTIRYFAKSICDQKPANSNVTPRPERLHMSFQLSRAKQFPGNWLMKPRSASDSEEFLQQPTTNSLACRFVQVCLALYLIPAFLVVVLFGILGIVILGIARIFGASHDTATH